MGQTFGTVLDPSNPTSAALGGHDHIWARYPKIQFLGPNDPQNMIILVEVIFLLKQGTNYITYPNFSPKGDNLLILWPKNPQRPKLRIRDYLNSRFSHS